MIDTEGSGEPVVRPEPAKTFLLWMGLLVPLGAWMIQLFSLYMLEDFISCTPGSQTPGFILGLGVRAIALAITGVLGLVTVATGISSWVLWRRMSEENGHGEPESAAKWMALAGILNSGLFALIIFIKAAPPLILGVCQNSL